MRKFNPEDITRENIGNFDAKMTSFENEAENLIMSIIKLLVYTELSQERVQHWQAQQETLERNIMVYRRCMEKHAHELRIAQNQVDNQMVDNKNFANFMADSNAVRVESLRIKISEKSQQEMNSEKTDKLSESVGEIEAKKSATSSRVENNCAAIVRDGEALSEKVNKVDFGNLKNESEFSISIAMREMKHLEENLEKIIVLKTELDDIVAKNGLDLNDAEVLESGILVDVKFEMESIKGEDDARELYTLHKATDDVKFSSFERRSDEDFAIFEAHVDKNALDYAKMAVDKHEATDDISENEEKWCDGQPKLKCQVQQNSSFIKHEEVNDPSPTVEWKVVENTVRDLNVFERKDTPDVDKEQSEDEVSESENIDFEEESEATKHVEAERFDEM